LNSKPDTDRLEARNKNDCKTTIERKTWKLGQFWRLLPRLINVLVRHRLDELILAITFFRPYSFSQLVFCPIAGAIKPTCQRKRIRLALQDLGPIFLSSFGQNPSRPAVIYCLGDIGRLPGKTAVIKSHLFRERMFAFSTDPCRPIERSANPERIFSHIDLPNNHGLCTNMPRCMQPTLTDGKQVILKLVSSQDWKSHSCDVDLLYNHLAVG